MATTNPVSQILASTGNQSLLAAGSRPDALAVGQIGVFNYHTGLSIDGTVAADAKDVFIAVGIDPLNTGSIADINKSAGQMIQVRNAKSYTFKGYLDTRPDIVDIAGFAAKCEKEYGVKIEFRNGQVYVQNGYNQFTKTFMYKTACCSDQCTECGDGDCNELATGLLNEINADTDKLATASYVANAITATIGTAPTADGNTVVTIGTTTYTVPVLDADTAAQAAAKIVAFVNAATGTPYKGTVTGAIMTFYPIKTINADTATFAVTGSGVAATPIVAATKTAVADLAAFSALYPGVCVAVRITSNPMATKLYTDINLGYEKLRATHVIVNLIEGFSCNGTALSIQTLRYAEGKGYDLKQDEYMDGGWNGKPGPYRVSETTGLARAGISYLISEAVNYNQFVLSYDQQSVGGWLEYLNNLETVIAIPCGDATTMSSLAGVLDAIFTQFGTMAGDVAANGDCTNASTNTLTPATDGIESLA